MYANPVTLIVFARYPEPGKAKTRLIPALGADGAAALQDAMTRRTLEQAKIFASARHLSIQVRFAGSSADAMSDRYGTDFSYVDQGSGDLGEKLLRAATEINGPSILIGTDCPALDADGLTVAYEALSRHDVVIGPAVDGGYYLIGMREPQPALFADISWSTDSVLSQTRAAATRANLSLLLLAPLADVDVPDDLPACSQWIPNLNEYIQQHQIV